MRKQLIALITAATACGAMPAQADDSPAFDRTAFAYDDYYRQGDQFYTSTEAGETASTVGSPTCNDPSCSAPCGDDGCCGDACACGDTCRGGCCGAVEGFSLAGLIGLADDSPLQVGGWTNLAWYDNNIPLSRNRNDLLSFDDIPDELNLAQQWLYIGRTVDGSAGLDLGGRIDVMYGTDGQKTQAFGNPTSIAGTPAGFAPGFGTYDASLDHGIYGWAIPQAYAEIASGDMAVKVGHFFTPVGYEVVPATGNFFHSHSYTMFNSEPFTHTGALATYSGLEAVTLYGGWTAGWDTGFDQFASGSNFLGGFGLEVIDNVTFTYMNTYGNFGWRDFGGDDSYEHSMVLSAQLTDALQYIAQSDYLRVDNDEAVSAAGLAGDTIGLNQYLIYKYSDLISLGGRLEWWKADGVSFYETTGGVNIHALNNLVFRPEWRQDWSPAGNIDTDTLAIDAILTY